MEMEVKQAQLEGDLKAMIDEQKNPPVVTPPLPWGQGA